MILLFRSTILATAATRRSTRRGVAAARAFSPDLYEHLRSHTLIHREPVTEDWCRQFLQLSDADHQTIAKHSDDAVFRFTDVNGQLIRSYLRPMLHTPMFCDSPAYGSFLVFARQQLMTRSFPTYLDGTEVPDEIVQEIAAVTNALAVPVRWQPGDLVMLDNTRFMHGRNPIGDPEQRRIYSQFGYAAFAPADYPNIDKHPWRRTDSHLFNSGQASS